MQNYFYETKQYAGALEICDHSLKILEASVKEDHHLVAEYCIQKAELLINLNKNTQSLKPLLKAYAIYHNDQEKQVLCAHTCTQIFGVYYALGRITLAIDFAKQAYELFLPHSESFYTQIIEIQIFLCMSMNFENFLQYQGDLELLLETTYRNLVKYSADNFEYFHLLTKIALDYYFKIQDESHQTLFKETFLVTLDNNYNEQTIKKSFELEKEIGESNLRALSSLKKKIQHTNGFNNFLKTIIEIFTIPREGQTNLGREVQGKIKEIREEQVDILIGICGIKFFFNLFQFIQI